MTTKTKQRRDRRTARRENTSTMERAEQIVREKLAVEKHPEEPDGEDMVGADWQADDSEEWNFAERQKEADRVVPIKPEGVRGQRSEVRGQKSEVGNQIQAQGDASEWRDWAPANSGKPDIGPDMPPVTKTKPSTSSGRVKAAKKDQQEVTENQEPSTKNQALRTKNQGLPPSSPLRPSRASVRNPAASAERMQSIIIEGLHPHPDNRPLKRDESFEQLVQSVKTLGIKQKPLVRPHNFAYQIIAGRRRIAAAEAAGQREVTCIVEELSDAEALEIIAIENLQRKDLDPFEQAEIFSKILALTNADGQKIWTQERLAKERGFSQPWIANKLRLLKLPPGIRDLVKRGQITEAHALAILPYAEHPELVADIAKRLRDDVKRDRLAPAKEFAAALAREKPQATRAKPVKTQDQKTSPAEEKAKAHRAAKVQKLRLATVKLSWLTRLCAEKLRAYADGARDIPGAVAARRYGELISGETLLDPFDVACLADELRVDREAAWRKEQLGPQTADFFDCYDKPQLVILAKEMGHSFVTPEREKLDGMIKTLRQPHRHLRMPKVLQAPKAKAKTTKPAAKPQTAKVAKKQGTRR